MNAQIKSLIKQHVGEATWLQGKARAEVLVRATQDAERRLSDVQWSWGDLSLEIVPMAIPGGDHSLAAVLLGAFIEDYQVPWTKATLHSLRQTAAAWPKHRRRKTSFAVHKILKPHPERFALIRDGMTAAEAMAIMGRKQLTPTETQRATAIECANAVKSWSRALERRLPDEDASDELLQAVADAWRALTQVAKALDMHEVLVSEFELEEISVG